jgi:hypothetical protein
MDFFKKVLFGLILAFIGTSGAMAQNITAVEGESGYLTFNMTPGTHYSFEATQFLLGFIPISYTVQPQVAIWVEDTEGNFIDTLYITDRVRKQDWMFAPSEGRPEALPVWSHLQTNDVDTVSHATPKGESKRSTQLMKGLPPGEYVVKLETNRSYDYNMDYLDIPVKSATNSGGNLPPETSRFDLRPSGRFGQGLALVFRNESPFSWIFSELENRRSQIASATVGSPKTSCQVVNGRWETTIVDACPQRSSRISSRLMRSTESIFDSPKSSRMMRSLRAITLRSRS